MAEIVVESPVEQYFLFMHGEREDWSPREAESDIQRITRAPPSLKSLLNSVP